MDLTEAEIQILASIASLAAEDKPTTRQAVDDRGEIYWTYKEDWSDAYDSLVQKGLIRDDTTGLRLTDTGGPIAENCRDERPDHYWYQYQKFYIAAHASQAHSELCQRVFGEDLCQDGQTDMASLAHLLQLLDLRPGHRVLDLGCGAGVIAEYIADQTGAHVTGLDFARPAIDAARKRTVSKTDLLQFETGNFNDLTFPADSFDAIISIDTLYWATDLSAVLARLISMLKPGGRLGIFMNHHLSPPAEPGQLAVEHSEPARALNRLRQTYESFDYTRQIGEFWQRNAAAAEALLPLYQAEGNGFIAEGLIRESRDSHLPDFEAGLLARYLYLVTRGPDPRATSA